MKAIYLLLKPKSSERISQRKNGLRIEGREEMGLVGLFSFLDAPKKQGLLMCLSNRKEMEF